VIHLRTKAKVTSHILTPSVVDVDGTVVAAFRESINRTVREFIEQWNVVINDHTFRKDMSDKLSYTLDTFLHRQHLLHTYYGVNFQEVTTHDPA
jgi:uncharacterized protein YaaW (UPF0174 family)